ncbi:hypothetical protein LAZ67_1000406 [Cordylochernes scorpioides]|uniref:Ubiquitinyl hydrolase 1 n=1 Tax=Cordylochernes scorpioides TaxID=51811 RepID=A0ABY6JUP7_9ARAC|nr:hypothetical protein LAZ67_1000406 [Cordylochernes scorpioides]
MEILKRHRNVLRKRLTRCLKTTEEFLSGTPPIPVEDIEYNREIIEETHSELLVIQGKIRDFMLTSDVSEEELEQDDEEALQYTQRYKRIYKKCLALVEPRITASSPTTSEVSFASSSHHRTVKLPKIELKKFTGEIKDWLGWWAQFNKLHVDPTLEDSDKFQYLVQSMSPGTRASKLVNSYPLTAENYPKVIETLTERFGRPELLQQVYVRDLIRLMLDCSSRQQLKVTSFYDELVTHLRALESLKIEARQMSVFIFPMIEACLSEELMKAWQRSPLHDVKIDANDSTQTRVDLIMEFLQKEAAAEQDRALAGSKFGLRSLKQDRNVGRQSHPAKIPTASGLFAGRAQNCIFCNKDHKNTECLAARRMSIKERRERIKNAKCCFSCLQPGHISSNCRRRITECIRCKKKHLDILCPLNAPGRESADEDKEQVEDCDVSPTVENGVSFSGLSASSLILLQTLKIKVEGATSAKVVRALLDTGSQRSYILSKTAQDLGLSPIGQESLKHVVFGGHTSESVHHEYRVNLGHASGNFKMVAKLLDQQKICGSLPRLSRGPWLKELKARRIWVPDIGKDDMEIEILLGCDVLGSIFMMKSCVLSNGLTASQTRFGWTLMGECQPGSDVSLAHHVTTMTISESSITNLWNLDVLGIMDPIEVKQRDQRDALARRHFLKTVQHSVSGRYVVSLPWTVEKAKIADNREVAMKRLEQTTKKLISLNLYEDYDDIFRGWLDDGIIEKVPAEQHDAEAFYLPHRPVVKLSSGTTPIRPVFDASSKVYRSPSLNDCLEKGPNLIEMIPNLMLRFRNGKFGVVADIKKAFLQIEVNERDRDYLRFLWYSQNREKTEVFRHRRVVFGVNCSSFILGAVIEYHLSNVRPEHKPLAQRLQKSFYVDNLVTSVNSFEELQDLKLTATSIMDNARLELSRWEHSLDVASDTYPFERAEISKVLGVCWDKREDCLSCEIPVAIPPKITKRSILSCLAQIYDPIGFLSPILIKPKIILQKAWTLKLAWDDELDRHYKDELSLWFDDLQLHKGMAIPRNFNPLMVPQKDWQIHTFVDASSEAYAAVVFLRTRVGDKVEVHMMAAKSRVAPLKRPTIPRLELLACVVGARLNKMIFEALELKDIKNVFWSDATTALAWIKRDDQWGTFVGNRVKEICRLSDPVNWRYVPSECNPADLPSRGCSLSRLIQSRWWEGPSWLKLSEEFWPSRYKDLNEEEICAERKKIAVVTTVKSTDHWYMKYFSSFIKNVRMMAWIRRFINNLRSSTKVKGELSVKEIDEAELALLKLVQAECFSSHSIPGLKVCEVEGILRVKTKLIYSSDEYGFRLPVLLHGTHPLIEQMICDSHVENCHAGVQFLMNKLREKYWIVKARQTIKKIVRRCVTCRRFSAKPVVVEDAPLPATRVHNAKVFEVVGIDLAGPLYLKDQTKTWVVLFTCAVYRCVHLELVISLSTEDFLMALERFIKRRGRPSTIFSDNGTNFVGANNFFKKIDWERVSNDGKVKRIEWKFIPPTAAWWGGWWERLIRSLKDILKRMLGTSTLTYQQLMTLLCHAEAVMNGRPMTYVSDDPNDLVTISPSMFLQEQTDVEFPECQNMGSNPTTQKLRYLSKLREELKSRFRKEYLSLLVQRIRRIYNPKLQAGDVVLVGMDNKKRNFWPLAVIEEILFGRDGVNRLVKVKTAVGTFLRPIQKIYPLEISSTAASSRLLNDKEKTAKIQTRSGRTICKPNRLDDYLCFSVCLDKNRWECVWNGGDPLFRAAQTAQVSTVNMAASACIKGAANINIRTRLGTDRVGSPNLSLPMGLKAESVQYGIVVVGEWTGANASQFEKTLGNSRLPSNEHYFGLVNFGNTCYCNSVLQALYFCKPFREKVLDYKAKNKRTKETLLTCLADLFYNIATQKKAKGTIAPKKFIARLRKENELFDNYLQQDAHEFLNYLLNTIADILQAERQHGNPKAKTNSQSSDDPPAAAGATTQQNNSKPEPTWVHDIFQGTLTNETRCLNCETVSSKDEDFLDLSVDIDQNTSITHCLRGFSDMETLCSEHKYYCENCCSKQEAQKRMRVKKLPMILALHLKRFKYMEQQNRHTKLSYRVVFPFELRLFNTSDDAYNPDRLYDLVAVVIHCGSGPNRGHYISIVKSHGQWQLFDDDIVDSLCAAATMHLSSRNKHLIHCLLFLSLILIFEIVTGGIPVWTYSFDNVEPVATYGYFFTVVLYLFRVLTLLALPQCIFNFLGLIMYNAFPDKVQLKGSPLLAPFVCIRVVTRGDFPDLVKNNVNRNINTCLSVGLENFIIEVVSDKPLKLPQNPRIRELVVPTSYRTKTGALFKARALQYCLEDGVTLLNDTDWIVHLDEETLLTENSVKGILNFVLDGRFQFGQGLITYANETIVNWLTTLADSFRVADDMGKLRFQFYVLHRPLFSWKGSYVVTQAGAEKKVSFENGLDGSIAEDCYFSMVAYREGYTFNFIEGEMWEKSPFTIWDFIQQRKRWIQGIFLVVHSPEIPLRNKCFLALALYSWATIPLTTSNIILAALFPLPCWQSINFTCAFIGAVNIYMYVFGVIKSFSLYRLGPFKFMLYLSGALCTIPFNIIVENIAVIWGLFSKKHKFYIVNKNLLPALTV